MEKNNIKAWVSSDTKTAFRAAAAKHGTSESRLLSLLVETFLQNNPCDGSPIAATDTKNGKFSFRLNEKLKGDLARRAKEQGMSAGSYFVALCRAHASQKPYFTEHELDVLIQSNNELRAIGRNINQIARALNTSLDNAHMARAAELVQVVALIKVHREYVGDLIMANFSAWGIERVRENY